MFIAHTVKNFTLMPHGLKLICTHGSSSFTNGNEIIILALTQNMQLTDL